MRYNDIRKLKRFTMESDWNNEIEMRNINQTIQQIFSEKW